MQGGRIERKIGDAREILIFVNQGLRSFFFAEEVRDEGQGIYLS